MIANRRDKGVGSSTQTVKVSIGQTIPYLREATTEEPPKVDIHPQRSSAE